MTQDPSALTPTDCICRLGLPLAAEQAMLGKVGVSDRLRFGGNLCLRFKVHIWWSLVRNETSVLGGEVSLLGLSLLYGRETWQVVRCGLKKWSGIVSFELGGERRMDWYNNSSYPLGRIEGCVTYNCNLLEPFSHCISYTHGIQPEEAGHFLFPYLSTHSHCLAAFM